MDAALKKPKLFVTIFLGLESSKLTQSLNVAMNVLKHEHGVGFIFMLTYYNQHAFFLCSV